MRTGWAWVTPTPFSLEQAAIQILPVSDLPRNQISVCWIHHHHHLICTFPSIQRDPNAANYKKKLPARANHSWSIPSTPAPQVCLLQKSIGLHRNTWSSTLRTFLNHWLAEAWKEPKNSFNSSPKRRRSKHIRATSRMDYKSSPTTPREFKKQHFNTWLQNET